MKDSLQEKLYKKYPKIFRQKDLTIQESCMPWGIECSDGWYKLIDMLCSILQWNTDKNKHPQVEATQVKEKYGTLNFYYNTIADPDRSDRIADYREGEIEGLIRFAEHMSGYICEECDTNRNIGQTRGWIKTLCKDCAIRYNQNTWESLESIEENNGEV